MGYCRRLLKISYKYHATNEEVHIRIQNAIGMPDYLHHGEETENQIVKPHLKIHSHGEDNSAGDSERSKKERKTVEDIGR